MIPILMAMVEVWNGWPSYTPFSPQDTSWNVELLAAWDAGEDPSVGGIRNVASYSY